MPYIFFSWPLSIKLLYIIPALMAIMWLTCIYFRMLFFCWQKNIGTIDTHVSDYQKMIDSLQVCGRLELTFYLFIYFHCGFCLLDCDMTDFDLQVEVFRLKKELAEKESQLSMKPADKAADDELSWLNVLSHEISENVQERINLQKALFELEETNLHNRTELQHLDESIANMQVNHLIS